VGAIAGALYTAKSLQQQIIIRKSTMIKHNKHDINTVYTIEKGVTAAV